MHKQKKHSGFTLLELIIVLAILAIIGIILIPNFFATTDRARLRSDIQSARVIHNAMVLYELERNDPLTGDLDAILARLSTVGLLSAGLDDIQTSGATWALNSGMVVVNIATSPDSVHSAYQSLTSAEQSLVINGRQS